MTLSKADDAGDSEDLQALFDSIAAGADRKPPPPPPASVPDASGDNDDLQALFDSVAATSAPAPVAAAPVAPVAAVADASGDNPDLEALFDSVAAKVAPAPVAAAAAVEQVAPIAPVVPASAARDAGGDNPDLEALFDSVAAQAQAPAAVPPAPSFVPPAAAPAPHDDAHSDEVVFNRLGQLARQLHDSLRELGYDSLLEDAAEQIPDARQRLAYIAEMTEKAASRVLNAADLAKPLQDDLITRSKALSARWDRMFANQLSVDEFKQLAADSRAFFVESPAKMEATNAQLMEIVMAQDFQDLTGQVIKKVVDLANGLEQKMLKVLIEVMPEARKTAAQDGLMNGPVINAEGRSDVVTSQEQVDDLLESLGF